MPGTRDESSDEAICHMKRREMCLTCDMVHTEKKKICRVKIKNCHINVSSINKLKRHIFIAKKITHK